MVRFLRTLAILSFSALLLGATKKNYQRGHGPSLGSILCKNSSNPSPQTFWQFGIYKSQVAAQKFRHPMTTLKLKKAAKAQSKKMFHLGYSWGRCQNGKSWIASYPTPVEVNRVGSTYLFSKRDLNKHCRKFKFSYAPQKIDHPRFITPPKGPGSFLKINTKLLSPGVLSLSCHPKMAKLGPQQWFLIPVNLKNDQRWIPYKTSMKKGFNLWVNRIRKKMELGKLSHRNLMLKTTAQKLLKNNHTVNHHHKTLVNLASDYKKYGLRLIGENRVIARSSYDAAWLMWYSPDHRRMLLARRASMMGVAKRNLPSKQGLYVLAFAR